MAKLANKLGDDSEITSKGRRRSYVPCILQLALHELGLNGWCTCATDTGGSTASLVCERNIDSRQCARCPENVVLATNVASDWEGDTSQAAIACGVKTDVTVADFTQTGGNLRCQRVATSLVCYVRNVALDEWDEHHCAFAGPT